MKKRYNEEQIIGFLKQADAGLPVGSGNNERDRLCPPSGTPGPRRRRSCRHTATLLT